MSALVLCLLLGGLSASAQRVALKTNLVHWAAFGSPNAALELRLADRWTADLYGGFNLWTFRDNLKAKHWAVQPEVRYWFCEAFNGTFIGLHGHGGQYNAGGFDIPLGRLKSFKDHRYQGYFYGAGLSLGYQWVLSPRWNLEASLGGGWARTHYDKFDCPKCGALVDSGVKDYFGVTRATLSLTYIIK